MSKMAHVDPLTCPFRSRYYPRIVPIPIRKRRKEEIQLIYNSRKLNNFWLPGQRTYIRNRFIQQQQQQQKLMQPNATCNVEWVNRITTSTSKYGNILALASLWDIVGNVTTNIQEQQSRVILDQNRIVRTVIALPDGDGYMIDQFVTMVQWLLERQQLHTQIFISYQNISIDFFMTIPTIVVTLHIPPTSSIPKQSTGSTERSFLEEQYTVKQSTTSTTTTISHDVITQRTKSWVQRVLVDTTICPFTKSITYSGQGLSDVNVPVGKIAYHTSHSSLQLVRGALDHDSQSVCTVTAAVCQLQSDVLVAIHDMLQAGPTYSLKHKLNGISSILLSAPGWDDSLELWTRIVFPILEVTVQVLDLTDQIGIVCFHPYYQTPDGRSFPGFGHMHSVPRLQQWLLEHTSSTDMELDIENLLPDLLTSKVINNPSVTMTTEDINYNIAISAIVTAGGAWQRRTPHATINILRAEQLAAAESKRITSTLYSTNILRLSRIGWSQLQQALEHERNME